MGGEVVRYLLVALGMALAGGTSVAHSQALSPIAVPRGDCRDQTIGRQGGVYNWRETVQLEHCDRIQRLWRITQATSYIAPPQFFDGSVGADRLPRTIGITMPILRVVFPERVFFDTAQSTLRPEAMEVVRVVAENLRREPPDVALFVAGHADERGGRDYNARLSSERANAVAEAIRREGINLSSVWRVGFGEDLPLARGSYEEAWGQNRRVEFLFAGRPEVIAQWMVDGQLDMVCPGRTRADTDSCIRQLALSETGYEVQEVVAPRAIDPANPDRTLPQRSAQTITLTPTTKKYQLFRSTPTDTQTGRRT